MQESYMRKQVTGQVMSQVMGQVTEYDEWVMREEESGDKVREAGTQRVCSGVLNDHNNYIRLD